MITSNLKWYSLNKNMPIKYRDILYLTADGSTHSGYLCENDFVEPSEDGELLYWPCEKITMWAYFPCSNELSRIIECIWYPYNQVHKPHDFQTILFVTSRMEDVPAVYCGYYHPTRDAFICLEDGLRFENKDIDYWMPLPKPPEDSYGMD